MLRTIAATLVAATLLTSCSDGDAAPPSPTPSITPFSDSASPTAEPAPPTEPVLPEAATKATPAGAEAFVVYYWDLISYAERTGKVAELRSATGGACDTCNTGIAGLRKLYADGGHIEDGSYSIDIRSTDEVHTQGVYAFKISAAVISDGEQVVVDGDGTRKPTSKRTVKYELVPNWYGKKWRMDSMVQR